MKQSRFRYLGLFDLLLVAVFVAAFGTASFAASVAIPAMALAGLFAVLAGSVAELSLGSVTVTWRHFVAATYALFALALPGSYLPDVVAGTAGRAELALFAVTSVGALTLLFFGYDVARGGDHFEVEPDVDTVVGR
ncbi:MULTISPECIES: hypothetical protein [Halorussus]|uniref:hypothetical protein n=1 Tax=Halorussus TaxID=1070314 RepID=UPI000E20E713|nr:MULTISPECIES: hypothetical protein [Halorussus]NHN60930.1 hypothetical protein [Halorussus sp. JP-T4]